MVSLSLSLSSGWLKYRKYAFMLKMFYIVALALLIYHRGHNQIVGIGCWSYKKFVFKLSKGKKLNMENCKKLNLMNLANCAMLLLCKNVSGWCHNSLYLPLGRQNAQKIDYFHDLKISSFARKTFALRLFVAFVDVLDTSNGMLIFNGVGHVMIVMRNILHCLWI